jgi:hypothetical protein
MEYGRTSKQSFSKRNLLDNDSTMSLELRSLWLE